MSLAATGMTPYRQASGSPHSGGAVDGGGRADSRDGEPATGATAAAALSLSPGAQALIDQAKAARDALSALPASFEEMVAKRTGDLSKSLMAAFAAENIPTDEAISFTIDASGAIKADGPYKKRIDKLLEDNPELAKELKAVATLHALQATREVMDLMNEELKAARSDEERDAARNRYMIRSFDIQSLARHVTLKDGALTSAASDYAAKLTALHEGTLPATGSSVPSKA